MWTAGPVRSGLLADLLPRRVLDDVVFPGPFLVVAHLGLGMTGGTLRRVVTRSSLAHLQRFVSGPCGDLEGIPSMRLKDVRRHLSIPKKIDKALD